MKNTKGKVIHNPKMKTVFSHNRSHNSSILNMSVNYKKQISSLRQNNRELARQLSCVQRQVKASEDRNIELTRLVNLQCKVPTIVSSNLSKMVDQLKSFLDLLKETLRYTSNPAAEELDSSILNQDFDKTMTPNNNGRGLERVLPRTDLCPPGLLPQHIKNFTVLPMTPIEELSSTESTSVSPMGQAQQEMPLGSGSPDAYVTRRTKSKSRSSASIHEEAAAAAPARLTCDKNILNNSLRQLDSSSEVEQLSGGCYIELERLPPVITSDKQVTPDTDCHSQQTFVPIDPIKRVPVTSLLPSYSRREDSFVDVENDDVTVKIPVDMDLTLVKQVPSSPHTVPRVELKDLVVSLDSRDAIPSPQPSDKRTNTCTENQSAALTGCSEETLEKDATRNKKNGTLRKEANQELLSEGKGSKECVPKSNKVSKASGTKGKVNKQSVSKGASKEPADKIDKTKESVSKSKASGEPATIEKASREALINERASVSKEKINTDLIGEQKRSKENTVVQRNAKKHASLVLSKLPQNSKSPVKSKIGEPDAVPTPCPEQASPLEPSSSLPRPTPSQDEKQTATKSKSKASHKKQVQTRTSLSQVTSSTPEQDAKKIPDVAVRPTEHFKPPNPLNKDVSSTSEMRPSTSTAVAHDLAKTKDPYELSPQPSVSGYSRPKRLTYVVKPKLTDPSSEDSSDEEVSLYCPIKKQATRKDSSAKCSVENFRFFKQPSQKQVLSKGNNFERKRKTVLNDPEPPGIPLPAKLTKVTGKNKENEKGVISQNTLTGNSDVPSAQCNGKQTELTQSFDSSSSHRRSSTSINIPQDKVTDNSDTESLDSVVTLDNKELKNGDNLTSQRKSTAAVSRKKSSLLSRASDMFLDNSAANSEESYLQSRSRRTKAVTYKEPSLNKKLRRDK